MKEVSFLEDQIRFLSGEKIWVIFFWEMGIYFIRDKCYHNYHFSSSSILVSLCNLPWFWRLIQVWGTLINFLGLRRMTSRGLKCANLALLMAAACYNLKNIWCISQKSKNKSDSPLQTWKERLCSIFFSSIGLTKAHTTENSAINFLQIKTGTKNQRL